MNKIRILLADDHEPFLKEVGIMLAEQFQIVGTVNNGQDAVAEIKRLDPDVIVTDISLPVLDGLQIASQLRSSHQRAKIVFLTVHSDEDFIDAAFLAGASGYVVKADVATDLVTAIREAQDGRTYISQSIRK